MPETNRCRPHRCRSICRNPKDAGNQQMPEHLPENQQMPEHLPEKEQMPERMPEAKLSEPASLAWLTAWRMSCSQS